MRVILPLKDINKNSIAEIDSGQKLAQGNFFIFIFF